MHSTLARSFSAPYPPRESPASDPCRRGPAWQQQPAEEPLSEEVYQRPVGARPYVTALFQRYAPASARPARSPGPPHAHPNAPVFFAETPLLDPVLQAWADLWANPTHHKWGCDLLEEEEACGAEAPFLEEGPSLALPYPQPLSQSLLSPLASTAPRSGPGPFDPPSPQNCVHPQLQTINHRDTPLSAGFIPGRARHAPVASPRPSSPAASASTQTATCEDSKARSRKKKPDERQRGGKWSSKSSRSQSENSLLGRAERRHSTSERRGCSPETGPQAAPGGARRRCGHPCHPPTQDKAAHRYQHLQQRLRPQERAPLCQEEDGAAAASASSVSDSSSPSSDSDQSGGLVWPRQRAPRFAPASSSSSSSSSPSPQTAANAASQPKAFVKIKASHALKRKILRFRSGSLKVMTTV